MDARTNVGIYYIDVCVYARQDQSHATDRHSSRLSASGPSTFHNRYHAHRRCIGARAIGDSHDAAPVSGTALAMSTAFQLIYVSQACWTCSIRCRLAFPTDLVPSLIDFIFGLLR